MGLYVKCSYTPAPPAPKTPIHRFVAPCECFTRSIPAIRQLCTPLRLRNAIFIPNSPPGEETRAPLRPPFGRCTASARSLRVPRWPEWERFHGRRCGRRPPDALHAGWPCGLHEPLHTPRGGVTEVPRLPSIRFATAPLALCYTPALGGLWPARAPLHAAAVLFPHELLQELIVELGSGAVDAGDARAAGDDSLQQRVELVRGRRRVERQRHRGQHLLRCKRRAASAQRVACLRRSMTHRSHHGDHASQ